LFHALSMNGCAIACNFRLDVHTSKREKRKRPASAAIRAVGACLLSKRIDSSAKIH